MAKKTGQIFNEEITRIIDFIVTLASGNLDQRLARNDESTNDHLLDAVVEGLNMLAEEIQHSTVSIDKYKTIIDELHNWICYIKHIIISIYNIRYLRLMK